MFYIFRAQTSAHMFTYDLLFGGAKYLPTGRGYKLAPTSFKDLYRRFGRSHFYFGAVLLMYAVACVAAGHLGGAELFVLWAQFLVVVSLLFGPFWFTPFAFRTTLVTVSWGCCCCWSSGWLTLYSKTCLHVLCGIPLCGTSVREECSGQCPAMPPCVAACVCRRGQSYILLSARVTVYAACGMLTELSLLPLFCPAGRV